MKCVDRQDRYRNIRFHTELLRTFLYSVRVLFYHHRMMCGGKMFPDSCERVFRLRNGGVECDTKGLRVAGLPLLMRGQAAGQWRALSRESIETSLNQVYGFKISAGDKMRGIDFVAESLNRGQLALAQIASLLLQLPNPTEFETSPLGLAVKAASLMRSGLLAKDWEEDEHPRARVPPNPGWFAPKPSGDSSDQQTTIPAPHPHNEAQSRDSSSPNGREQQVAVRTGSLRYACRALRLDYATGSAILHDLKEHAGLTGGDNCTFDTETGDVFFGDEHIGNLGE